MERKGAEVGWGDGGRAGGDVSSVYMYCVLCTTFVVGRRI